MAENKVNPLDLIKQGYAASEKKGEKDALTEIASKKPNEQK